MRILHTPIIKFTLLFLTGVITGFYLKIPVRSLLMFLIILFGLFTIAYVRARKQLFQDKVFGVVTLILFFTIGFFTTTVHLPQNQKSHFLQLYASESSSGKLPVLGVKIREELKPDLYHHKYIAEVYTVSTRTSHGRILLLVPKDSLMTKNIVGDRFLVATELKEIQKPLNPYQFDYKKYMANRGISKQVILKSGYFQEISAKNGILETTASWRKKITASLKEDGFKPEELAIVQALLLGQKQDISVETYNNYAAAGAIHILAVSGLHVGILLLLLNWLFSPLIRFNKGKLLRTILSLLILWGFAVLAGLSPSVVRAVTMFSFLAVAMELKRRTSSLNSLFLSMLLLLLIRPQWIFEVGFQLSYLAVVAIILLQPILFNLFYLPNKIARFFWGIFTTTLAAQAGVLPLSLFYFHQFPGLFFLSNLVILPFLGLILGTGIIIILLSLTGSSISYLTEGFNAIISLLNSFVALIAKQEKFLFQDISFGLLETWGWYFLLICLVLLTGKLKYQKIVAVLVSLIALQSFYLYKAATVPPEDLLIFHRGQQSIIAKQKNEQLQVYQNPKEPEHKVIRNYTVGENIREVTYFPYQQIFMVKGEILLVIDSTGIYPKKGYPDYLLLTGSPNVNLDRVIQTLQPSMIIADGNNYRSKITQWERTANEKNIPFYFTGEQGAFRLSHFKD